MRDDQSRPLEWSGSSNRAGPDVRGDYGGGGVWEAFTPLARDVDTG
jgi:hypothetical protein